jgi:hypothetical protein
MEGQAGVAEEAKAAREAVGRLSAQFKVGSAGREGGTGAEWGGQV